MPQITTKRHAFAHFHVVPFAFIYNSCNSTPTKIYAHSYLIFIHLFLCAYIVLLLLPHSNYNQKPCYRLPPRVHQPATRRPTTITPTATLRARGLQQRWRHPNFSGPQHRRNRSSPRPPLPITKPTTPTSTKCRHNTSTHTHIPKSTINNSPRNRTHILDKPMHPNQPPRNRHPHLQNRFPDTGNNTLLPAPSNHIRNTARTHSN